MVNKNITGMLIGILIISVAMLSFSMGVLYTQSNIDTHVIMDTSNGFSVYERGEIVTTSEEFYDVTGYNFTGTIVHINYHDFGNVLTIYNPETKESKEISESWIDNFAEKNYEELNNE